ncbi:MAG: tetratricopeptide repeat protein [Myxococcota bacterium]
MKRDRSIRVVLATFFCVVVGAGCASTGPAPVRPAGGPALRIERPDRAADYDVLVAELAQAEGDFEQARAAYARAVGKDPGAAFLHDRLARLSWQLDDVDGALREAEHALELDPSSISTRLFLGRLYNLRRDFDGLDRVLRREDGEPIDADATFALHQVAIERQDLAEAEALAKKLMALEPDQLRGLLALVSVYEARQEYAAAEQALRDGLERFPGHFLLYMRLAQLEHTRGDRAGEIAIYRELLEEHPNHYGVLQRLGQAQIDANDVPAAMETFGRIVHAYPDDLNALRRLASLEFASGRYESAAERLEQILARSPGDSELAIAVGQIRRAAGDDAGAIEVFDRIPAGDPRYVEARVQISFVLESQGKLAQALDEIERLRAVAPERALDLRAAGLLSALGEHDLAVTRLEVLLDGTAEDAAVYYQLGVVEGARQRVDESLRHMQKVLELDPKNAAALNYIGYSWAERGENLDEAETMIRRALALSPDDGYITDSLGWVYYKMAEMHFEAARKDEALALLERARKQLLEAAKLTGGDPVVSEHLGDVHLLRGEKARALEYYEEAAGQAFRASEQPDLFEKIDRLRRELGRPPRSDGAP